MKGIMNIKAKTIGTNGHLFSTKELVSLLVPVILEQFLTALMGTMDTVMVSNVGSAAISSVSLVDSINTLIIQIFAALTAGGAIVCAHYIGKGDSKGANHSARQLIFIVAAISSAVTVLFLIFRFPLLHLIFGSVEKDVMQNAEIYFFYTALSYPFISVFSAGSAIFRSQENTHLPLKAAIYSNLLNIGGNAVLIFGFRMGVRGAAIPTLLSRIYGAVYVLVCLRRPGQTVVIRDYAKIRPDSGNIARILTLGIPSGIENGFFQLGKLAVQSTVSTMGTISIAAQAMTNVLENLNGMAGIGVGIALMTVVGECLGAGRKDEAVYYVKKLTMVAELLVSISCLLFWLLTKPITALAGMEPASAAMCFSLMTYISIVKPVVWTLSFVPAYGMRSAGDVKYSMTVSCISMWICRVTFCIFLVHRFHMGPLAVWIGMFTDWTVRGLFMSLRFHSRKWLKHNVI